MALINRFFKRSFFEEESRSPLNILVCFAKHQTGVSLCKIANYLTNSKCKNEQIASLHLLNKEEYDKIENIDEYKTTLYQGIIEECSKGSAIVRTFVKSSENFVDEILSTSKKLACNLVLIGIGKTVFSPQLWSSYQKFKSNEDPSENTEPTPEELAHKGVSTLLERNEQTTGIFIDHGLDTINHIFIPLLDSIDIHIFDYINHLSEKTDAKITVWDAIGAIDSSSELKKAFNRLRKRAGGKISIWDNRKKINYEFINFI